MMDDIDKLMKERDALNKRIQELQTAHGRFKIKCTKHPTHEDDWKAFARNIPKREYYSYSLLINYMPIDSIGGKSRWSTIFVAESKDEVLHEIPKIIKELQNAEEYYKKNNSEECKDAK